jgi:hypothetical protein
MNKLYYVYSTYVEPMDGEELDLEWYVLDTGYSAIEIVDDNAKDDLSYNSFKDWKEHFTKYYNCTIIRVL